MTSGTATKKDSVLLYCKLEEAEIIKNIVARKMVSFGSLQENGDKEREFEALAKIYVNLINELAEVKKYNAKIEQEETDW